MIYDIHANDNDTYRDVTLDAVLTDYRGETWRAVLTLDKSEMTQDTMWLVSADGRCTFEVIARDKVPRWFRALADRMKPRIIEEHLPALIDAYEADKRAELEERRREALQPQITSAENQQTR